MSNPLPNKITAQSFSFRLASQQDNGPLLYLNKTFNELKERGSMTPKTLISSLNSFLPLVLEVGVCGTWGAREGGPRVKSSASPIQTHLCTCVQQRRICLTARHMRECKRRNWFARLLFIYREFTFYSPLELRCLSRTAAENLHLFKADVN